MVLDDLYCGNIYPAEQVVPHEKEYRKLHRHTGELLTELEEKLSKEQMELVNQFHTHVIDVHCMELEAHFQYGFSLGVNADERSLCAFGKPQGQLLKTA